ncbi:tubulin-folding cofactor B [Pleuronectes platessa]|uniref:tubulin-folding cofactor B n=1 Tax=Pleuronectes platessa TaxID=8262 RepID=UPI00232A4E7E|nr:tubulin-folding cofactor B [Pleuronectes platessa]
MEDQVTVITNPLVNVRITSTVYAVEVQRRFNRGLCIADLKGKLEMAVGTPAGSMDLELYSVSDKFMLKMDDNDALLGSYPVDDDCRIHVIDKSGQQVGEFTDVSEVEKFELSDRDYEKRTDSARSFMKRNRVGRFNEEETAKKQAEMAARENEQKAAAEAISVGNRCQVLVPGQPTKVATVMYVGTTDFKPGCWVGVKYDEPLGKHNGTVQEKQYFDCEMKYGAFVKPLNVTVGDFPEEDYGIDEM